MQKIKEIEKQKEEEIEKITKQKEEEIKRNTEQKEEMKDKLDKATERIDALERLLDSNAEFEEIVLTQIGEEENAAFIAIDFLPKNTRKTVEDAKTAGSVFYFIEDREQIKEKIYVKFDFDSQLENWSVKLLTSYGAPIKLVPYGKKNENMYWFEPMYHLWEERYIVQVTDEDTKEFYYFFICI